MTRAIVVTILCALGGCFTDFEIGGDASIGTSSGTAEPGTTDASANDTTTQGTLGGGEASSGVNENQCGEVTPGEGSCPPRCSGGCALGTCTIACHEESPCDDIDVVCPQGWPCVVLCDGPDACKQATIHCSDSACELQCPEADSCDNLVMMCGTQSCNAWCGDEEAGVDEVDCGASCDCQTNCASTSGGPDGTSGGGDSSD